VLKIVEHQQQLLVVQVVLEGGANRLAWRFVEAERLGLAIGGITADGLAADGLADLLDAVAVQ
jgi:hypothetical protein